MLIERPFLGALHKLQSSRCPLLLPLMEVRRGWTMTWILFAPVGPPGLLAGGPGLDLPWRKHQGLLVSMRASDLHQTGPRAHGLRNEITASKLCLVHGFEDSPRARDYRAKKTTSPNLISGDKTDSTKVWMVTALIGVTAHSSSMGDRARIQTSPTGRRILARKTGYDRSWDANHERRIGITCLACMAWI
jgi:hypothetical protein